MFLLLSFFLTVIRICQSITAQNGKDVVEKSCVDQKNPDIKINDAGTNSSKIYTA